MANAPNKLSSLFWRRVAVAPLCLCAVAAWHVWRVSSIGQTPWKGGGFGMFSTVDSEAARYLQVWISTGESDLPVIVPKFLESHAQQIRVAPTHDQLAQLARLLGEVRWRIKPGEKSPLASLETDPVVIVAGDSVPITNVRVELWRYSFHAAANELRAEKLDEVQFAVPAAKEDSP